MEKADEIMQSLLESYDWNLWCIHNTDDGDEYLYGEADAIGQAILNIGKILGESYNQPYKFEAYKRVMQFESVEQYVREYKKPISKLQRKK